VKVVTMVTASSSEFYVVTQGYQNGYSIIGGVILFEFIVDDDRRKGFVDRIDQLILRSFFPGFEAALPRSKERDTLSWVKSADRAHIAQIVLSYCQISWGWVPQAVSAKKLITDMAHYIDLKLPELYYHTQKHDRDPHSTSECYELIGFQYAGTKKAYKQQRETEFQSRRASEKQQAYIYKLALKKKRNLKKPIEELNMLEASLIIAYFKREIPKKRVRHLIS